MIFFRTLFFLLLVSSFGHAIEPFLRSHSIIDRSAEEQEGEKQAVVKHVAPVKASSAVVTPLQKQTPPRPKVKPLPVKKGVAKKAPPSKPKSKSVKPAVVTPKVSPQPPKVSTQKPPIVVAPPPPVQAPVVSPKVEPVAPTQQELDISQKINQAISDGEKIGEINESVDEVNESVLAQEPLGVPEEVNETSNIVEHEHEGGVSTQEIVIGVGGVGIIFGVGIFYFGMRNRKLSKKMESLSELSHRLQQSVEESHIYTKETKDLFKKFDQEIRKPLVIIRESIEQLGQTPLNDQQHHALTNLYESAECLVSMIDQASDFSKVHHGEIAITQEPFKLSTLFHALEQRHKHQAKNRSLKLTFVQSEFVPNELIGDIATLEHILDELIDNAIHFTEVGEIEVGAYLVKEGEGGVAVRFEVKDTGVGISQDRLNRLMSSPKSALLGHSERPSLGVGLAISKALTQALGGALTAQSHVGKGSIFYVVVTMEVVKQESVEVKPMVAKVGKRIATSKTPRTKKKSFDPAVIPTLKEFVSLFEFSPNKIRQLALKEEYDELTGYLQSIHSICTATHAQELLLAVSKVVDWAKAKGEKGDVEIILDEYKKAFLSLKEIVDKA